MSCQEKQIFDKKEINQKYTELWEGKKKILSTDQLRNIVAKYNLKNVSLQGKNEVHPLWNDMDHSVTQVKIEEAELSKEMSSLNITIKEDEEDEENSEVENSPCAKAESPINEWLTPIQSYNIKFMKESRVTTFLVTMLLLVSVFSGNLAEVSQDIEE